MKVIWRFCWIQFRDHIAETIHRIPCFACLYQLKIGRITVSGEEVKYDESDYSDTRSAIENKLLNVYGGYIRTRKEKDGYYIDYLKEYEDVEGQTIQFGDNVLDISKYIKSDGIKTCIIPIGATNSATGKPITIKSVNNDMDYIYDQAAVDAFGMIFGTVNYSDVESPEILLKQAQEYIKDVVNLAITIELTAVDLKDAGFDVKELEIGDKIPVISKPHGIDSYMQISKVSKNLKQADDSKVTLGSTLKALTDKQVNNADSVSLRISEIRSKMYNLPGLSLEPITNEVLEGILN